MSNFFSQQTTLVKCVVLVLSFWHPMMEQMGNSGLLSSQDESRNYDIRPRYIKVLHYKQKNNNREHLQRKKRTPLRWISLSNKMIHTLIASTTFLIIHATTIYTWAAKHWRSSTGCWQPFYTRFCTHKNDAQKHSKHIIRLLTRAYILHSPVI